jgi:hypothetical protein
MHKEVLMSLQKVCYLVKTLAAVSCKFSGSCHGIFLLPAFLAVLEQLQHQKNAGKREQKNIAINLPSNDLFISVVIYSRVFHIW